MTPIDLGNLRSCVADVQRAARSTDGGPPDPADYADLLRRLALANGKLPPLYREVVGKPFSARLKSLGPSGYRRILKQDPRREGAAALMLDIAQAVLQNGENYQKDATDSFQEVVSDLYDGFLSAADRRGVKPPDHGVAAPLVKWGAPEAGPYTWPVDATSTFGVGAAIVSLPPANAGRGILAWAALGHETAGHDILSADLGLHAEMGLAVERALDKAKLPDGIPEYWSRRIDEAASDVMGILNMGPAAGIGLIGYLLGMNAAYTGTAALDNEGAEDDPHPADILRAFLAAATVRQLRFSLARDWARAIEAETLKHVRNIVLEERPVTPAVARQSAEVVAATLVGKRMNALERHSLGEIQNWRDQDEAIVAGLSIILKSDEPLPSRYPEGVFAAHVVAAAVAGTLEKGARIAHVFERMLASLKAMHDANPSWGPLYVMHPGDVSRRLTRIRPPVRTAILPLPLAGDEPSRHEPLPVESVEAGQRGAALPVEGVGAPKPAPRPRARPRSGKDIAAKAAKEPITPEQA
jgi:hypothetical protein